MARRMIFDDTTLVFTTYSETTIDPVTLFTVDGEVDTTVKAVGDLQPYFPSGQLQISTPEGFTLDDAKMFITDVQLPTINDVGATKAATTEINGRQYYIARKFDFSNGSLSTDAIFYVLVMKKLKDGSD